MLFVLCVLVGVLLASILATRRSSLAPPAVRAMGVFLLACVVGAVLSCIAQVPAGHVGVVDVFGRVSDRSLDAGLRLVNPLARVIRMSLLSARAVGARLCRPWRSQ